MSRLHQAPFVSSTSTGARQLLLAAKKTNKPRCPVYQTKTNKLVNLNYDGIFQGRGYRRHTPCIQRNPTQPSAWLRRRRPSATLLGHIDDQRDPELPRAPGAVLRPAMFVDWCCLQPAAALPPREHDPRKRPQSRGKARSEERSGTQSAILDALDCGRTFLLGTHSHPAAVRDRGVFLGQPTKLYYA